MEGPSSNSLFSLIKNSLNIAFTHPKEVINEDSDEGDIRGNLDTYFNTTISEVMVPRTKMVTIDKNSSLEEAVKLFQETRFSRIPVQENERDNIVGVLYAIDLFQYFYSSPKIPVHEVMRKPFFASYSQPINHLLSCFKANQARLAIVIDEYGGVDGLVTMSDILGELVGDLPEEFIKSREPSYEYIQDQLIIMDSDFSLEDFNKLYGTDFFKEGIETIGGFICHSYRAIPQKGETIKLDSIQFSVEEGNGRAISKLRLVAPDVI